MSNEFRSVSATSTGTKKLELSEQDRQRIQREHPEGLVCDLDEYVEESRRERLEYESQIAELRANGELPPEDDDYDHSEDEDINANVVINVKNCIDVDKCHTFQAVAEDGDLFLYFGIDNRELIFTKWKPALLENLRDVCITALKQRETELRIIMAKDSGLTLIGSQGRLKESYKEFARMLIESGGWDALVAAANEVIQ